MTDLAACIQRAIDDQQLDPERGRRAQQAWQEQVQRHADAGADPGVARQLAAEDVMDAIAAGNRRKRHRTLAQIRNAAQAQRDFAGIAATNPDALPRSVEFVEANRAALEQRYMARLSAFLQANRTKVTGGLRNRALVEDVTRELHGQHTGNVNAAEMARSVEAVQEIARRHFNMLGGDIGKLENRGVAHSHNARAIEAAGFDRWFATLWDGKLIDWHRITDFATNKPFTATPGGRPNRAAAERFLRDVYEGIVSGGWDTREPTGRWGTGATAQRRKEHRVLHFTDGDAWLAYNGQFGSANPFDAIVGELRGMARDIALMQAFGPDPRLGFELRAQIMHKDVAGTAGAQPAWNIVGSRPLRDVVGRKTNKARAMFRHVTGEANTPLDGGMATFFAGVRNVLTAAQLGSAVLSSVTDLVTVRMAAKAMGMAPIGPYQRALSLMTNRITQQEAADLGYVMDTWFHTGAAQARMIGDVWSPEWTNRLTNFTMRSTGLSFWTDHARSAMRMTFSVELGEQAARAFDELDPRLRGFLAARAITPADWDALRGADVLYQMPSGGRAISPAWFAEHSPLPMIEREAIAARLSRAVEDFTELGVPSASLRGRVTITGDMRPGSAGGELLRSTAMYKSFALSMMFNHFRRAMELRDTGSGAMYAGALIAQLTLMGGIAIQLKELAKGRDPRDMTSPQFWGAAALQGGGIGIFGDFLTATSSRTGGGLAETVAGPVVGLAGDLGRAVNSNIARLAEGRAPLIGRDVVNLARRYSPLASHAALRTALDRIVWDQLQALIDPEAREEWGMARRRAVQSGTDFFWQRGAMAPERGPNVQNAIGGGQ